MKCSKCGYEPTMAEVLRSPDDCVSCGASYAGKGVPDGDVRRVELGTTHVIIDDINMSFWSMVRFMVKWAIAAMPALAILAIIAYVAILVGTVIIGASSEFARLTTQRAASFPVRVESVEPGLESWILSATMNGQYTEGVIRSRFENGSEYFSTLSVDCALGKALVTGIGTTLDSMRPLEAPTSYEAIAANTARQSIAKRICQLR